MATVFVRNMGKGVSSFVEGLYGWFFTAQKCGPRMTYQEQKNVPAFLVWDSEQMVRFWTVATGVARPRLPRRRRFLAQRCEAKGHPRVHYIIPGSARPSVYRPWGTVGRLRQADQGGRGNVWTVCARCCLFGKRLTSFFVPPPCSFSFSPLKHSDIILNDFVFKLSKPCSVEKKPAYSFPVGHQCYFWSRGS